MDNFKNFAKATVSTGYDASATSIALTAGHGAKLPTPPFNATWWNSTDFADPSDDPNVELIRVTALASDTLTITRGQEGITASTKNAASKTYKLIAGLTAKTINTDLLFPLVAQVRLTLEAGAPVQTADQLAKTSIKVAPYGGNRVSLLDGSTWNTYTLSGELDLPLGTLANTFPHDVFIVAPAGSGDPTVEKVAWTSDVARAEAVSRQDGRWVKTSDPTRLLLGSFKPTTTTATEDSAAKRLLDNVYNRVPRRLRYVPGGTGTYSHTSATWRQQEANANNRLDVMISVRELFCHFRLSNIVTLSAMNQPYITNIGYDSTTVELADAYVDYAYIQNDGVAVTRTDRVTTFAEHVPDIGFHSYNALELAPAAAVAVLRAGTLFSGLLHN